MTQQPYQQPYGQPYAPPQPPYQPPYQGQPYAPAPQQYQPPQLPQQGYGQPPTGNQGPAVPLATGTLDQFYSQPTAAGGPGISWKNKPEGTTYFGVVDKDVTGSVQDTDFDTGRPLFQRDGVTPKFVMQIPLQINPQQFPEFPEGTVVFYVRGQAKDELARAMAEAGCWGGPKKGAFFQVTLVQRRPNRKGNPSNIVQISYQPPNGVPHGNAPDGQQAQPAAAQQEQPQAQQPVQQYQQQVQAPVQQPMAQPPVQAQQQYQQPAAQQFQAPPVAQPQFPLAEQYAHQPVAPGAPQGQPMAQQGQVQVPVAPQGQPAPVAPAGLDPAQQAIMAQLIQGQQGQQQQPQAQG